MKAKITINKNNIIGNIDRRIYGSFIEHLGRAVYGGIYEPNHPLSDENGFRGDVLELTRELNVSCVRYPGGNFVSGYNWEDGIGKKDLRPKKLDLAWLSLETNEVGIDEFQKWAKLANTEIMMAVNLGTRGPDEARNLIEYCNSETDSYYANLRRKNGFEKPFGIKLWCLGNEMDGDWQICHKTAEEYARIATETAKVLRWVDPSIELVACGSSDPNMPTYGEWERTVLRHTYDYVDYISLHCYFGNKENNTYEFLAKAEKMDSFIKQTAEICDEIKKEKGHKKAINLSFDEWNVWYRTKDEEKDIERWQIAPHLLEEKYNFEDCLLVGSMLSCLHNNCDRVKIACLAQLVNVIAPIMTEENGKAWLQTIYYPFMFSSLYGNGTALKQKIECDTYKLENGSSIPYIFSSAIDNKESKEIIIFVTNRSLDNDITLNIELDNYKNCVLSEHTELYSENLKAENKKDSQLIAPISKKIIDTSSVVLRKHSWNMLKFKYEE